MKRMLFAVLPVAAFALFTLHAIDPLPIGSAIPDPDIKLKDISGKEISLQDARGEQGLLVMFSCNTCPYVIKNQARTLEACKYAQDNHLDVAIINSNEANRSGEDSPGAMKQYAKEQGYQWLYLIDEHSTMANAFGANRTPECFLFNKDGKLVYHGAIDDNPANPEAVGRKHLLTAIEEMKSGRDVTVKESRSVGCAIKRME